MNQIYHGLFQEQVSVLADQSVDLVLTSPPYANQRKALYGGIDEEIYPAWTVDWMHLVKRILKPTGNVAIIIRPHVRDGQISDYMLRARLALRDDGWRECDEWIWYKPDAPPIGHPLRPRRSWESIHWFSLSKYPYSAPKAGGQSSKKIGFRVQKGLGQQFNGSSDGFSHGIARITDVISAGIYEVDRSTSNTHPAQFPSALAEQIIVTLCPPHGLVLDPFIGSGTTAIAALKTQRQYVGFEKEAEYVEIARRRIHDYETCQPDPEIFAFDPPS